MKILGMYSEIYKNTILEDIVGTALYTWCPSMYSKYVI